MGSAMLTTIKMRAFLTCITLLCVSALLAGCGPGQPGLVAHVYQGQWAQLPVFSDLPASGSQVVPNVGTHNLGTDNYALVLKGVIRVETAGQYRFHLTSDDGSRLLINDAQVIDNDGSHGAVTVRSGWLQLAAGDHEIRVEYFQATGGQTLTLDLEGADGQVVPLPEDMLFHFNQHTLSDAGAGNDDNSGGNDGGNDNGGGTTQPGDRDTTQGLDRFSSPDAALYSLNDSRNRVFPSHIDTGFSGNGHAETWDGRIFVVTRSAGWFAAAFRPERITRNGDGSPNFRNGAFGSTIELELETEAPDMQHNWIALVPDPAVSTENPYPSDSNGNYRASGSYRTYKALVYHTSLRNGDNDQMGIRRATFIVRDAQTANAQLVRADFTSSFQKLRLQSGADFRCIEMTVTFDGRFIVCQGHPDNNGRIDNLVYSWNATPGSTTGWRQPRSLADLYFVDRNSNVAGIPLHVRYPIAKHPIKDAAGAIYERGQLIKGAYPWISHDGTELFYQASREGVSARRTGTSVVGRWTGWLIRHIDGPINRDRHATSKLFLSSPGAFTTMWNPYTDVEDLPIPYAVRGPSYPIFGSNTRDYMEVEFDDYLDGNYVLALGMNEQLDRAGSYQVTRTPDTSGNFNNATLQNGAAFPREFNGNDRLEGRYGQGIYFPAGSYLQVARNQGWESLQDGITVDLFVRRINGSSSDVELFNLGNGVRVYLAGGNRLSAAITDTSGTRVQVSGATLGSQWTHVAARYDADQQQLALFINGNEVAERATTNFGTLNVSGQVRIGPVNSSGLLMLDEVHVSNVARHDYEIAHNAYKNQHKTASQALLNTIPDHLALLRRQASGVDNFTFAAATLGEALFSDEILSRQRTTSCATCHEANRAFTDGLAIAKGNEPTDAGERNTPMLQNRLFSSFQGWDGNAISLDTQSLIPIQAVHEMNLPIDQAVQRLRGNSQYAAQFQSVYGELPNARNIPQALASFMAIQFSAPTRVDDYLAGNSGALTAAEQRGFDLFKVKARCAGCHAGANFTDESFRSNGLVNRSDTGRARETGRERDHQLFKVPSLRAVAQTAPYMHDGSIATLRQVVERYNDGATGVAHVDSDIRPLGLTSQEISDLVAFLNALSGNGATQTGDDNGGDTGTDPGNDGNGSAVTDANTLSSNERLELDQYLESSNGNYRLYMQGDGNLVLRDWQTRDSLWSTGTHTSGAVRVSMQSDGNLVIRDAGGAAVWSTGTHNTGANRLTLNDDGTLVLYQDSSIVLVLH